MKNLLAVTALAMLIAAPVNAETIKVDTTDLNLAEQAGVEQLTYRLLNKVGALCGRKVDEASRLAKGLTRAHRDACIDEVTVDGGAAIQNALLNAKARARYDAPQAPQQ